MTPSKLPTSVNVFINNVFVKTFIFKDKEKTKQKYFQLDWYLLTMNLTNIIVCPLRFAKNCLHMHTHAYTALTECWCFSGVLCVVSLWSVLAVVGRSGVRGARGCNVALTRAAPASCAQVCLSLVTSYRYVTSSADAPAIGWSTQQTGIACCIGHRKSK